MQHLPGTPAARRIVRRHAAAAAATGLLPVPALDFVATSAVTIRMVKALADLYGIEFRTESARAAVASLGSSAAATLVAFGPGRSLLKAVPGIGQVAGLVAGPITSGAFTYAMGQVFTMHFGLGGALHDFDPEQFQAYFAEQLRLSRLGGWRGAPTDAAEGEG